ncbi:hypothetical protein JIN84_13010 [Luteolibacter yonseiensis]|uniref:Uncharacterized protein n=1 Tax=Luteolibacter yonseiensis TaxID=1144680 RepID=A0A934R436_9BACT|nr:hypothetical protein [Luteolibacter yonseiensis]MBK1816539.1 hypothetical protein [Luteolibacter yonseiensis]
MTFTINLDTLTLVRGPQDSKPALMPEAKRGDGTPFEVVFVRNGIIGELEADTVLTFGCKAKGKYDGPAVVLEDGFVKSGSGATTKYSASPSFNTEGLNDLFAIDGNDANDVTDVILMAEFSWKVDDGEPTSTRTFEFKVSNDVLRGDETTPAVLPDPEEWMPAAIILDGPPADGVLAAGSIVPTGDATGAELIGGDITYVVVTEALNEFEIQYHPDEDIFCDNIVAAINGTDFRNDPNTSLTAFVGVGPSVALTSKIPAEAGNSIPLSTDMPAALDIDAMSGGVGGTLATRLGQPAISNEADAYMCVRLSPVKWVGPLNS